MKYDEPLDKAEQRDTEITLSNTTLLLIFLGVAIICGVFFGFGYTIGKRNAAPAVATVASRPAEVAEVTPPVVVSAPVTPAPAPPVATPPPAEPVTSEKPAVSEKPSAAAATAVTPAPAAKPAPAAVVKPAPAPAPVAAPVATKPAPPAAQPHPAVVTPKPVVAPKPPVARPKQPPAAPAATPAPAPVTEPSRTYVVQVAAVSHQADADVLAGALRRKGYAVNSYPGTQDNLIHVQVGPFSSQKDALAMRDKLSNDGYLAIVK